MNITFAEPPTGKIIPFKPKYETEQQAEGFEVCLQNQAEIIKEKEKTIQMLTAMLEELQAKLDLMAGTES